MINNNKDDIDNNKNLINTNKSSYNLNEIYTYNIQNGYKFVDKNNHYLVFEKEIIYDFIKRFIFRNYFKSTNTNIELYFNRVF